MAEGDRPPASELLAAVGRRVRQLRNEQRLTLDELSARSGVSRRMITLLEGGEANASLGTLDKLARALGSDCRALVGGVTAAPLTPVTARSVAPVWADGRGSTGRLLVTAGGCATAELWQWRLAAGTRYDADADRPGSEEVVIVTAGQLAVEIAGGRYPLGAGDYIRLPTDEPYAYVNPGRSAVRFLRLMLLD